MKNRKTRAILSTILILSGLLSIVTGTILYFVKYGMWLCFTRKFINDTHAVSGVIMGVTAIIHFILNRHMYMLEMRTMLPKGDD